ncbi:MAG: guanylate kinase [Bauldia sp.]|nr:guanylate kinase [Bauldia sp.]
MAIEVVRRGLMLILSSPSGAGKSTLSRLLLQEDRDLSLSISVTTRQRRPSEVDGVHYRFVNSADFVAMRERGELLEWAEVHGNLYGTPRGPVEAALASGRDVLFDIDWQGTRQIADAMPDDIVRIFVLPPSMAELRARLERRAEDGADVIGRRLANARTEIGHWDEYEYVIVNDDLQRSLGAARMILAAERQKRVRQPALVEHVARLLSE